MNGRETRLNLLVVICQNAGLGRAETGGGSGIVGVYVTIWKTRLRLGRLF